ncbi:MAG: tyrosyl-tRNA synthetase [Thermoleophilaceae bacterium]|nr:tyrosyl-tRNA synthetase [Thermoleophilaceae bacterium]
MDARVDPGLLDDLRWRGLVADTSDPGALAEALKAPLAVYAGYDPTASSLHVGNLQVVILLRRFQLAGHTPIALAGGGTGLIGDPSGKADERALQTPEVIEQWAARIRHQLARLLPAEEPVPVFEDNLTWIGPLGAIELLRDVGKHFAVSQMLTRESVATRVGEGGSGMSFTEFSYMVLQAFDFQQLYDRHACRLQVGGSDQWGNIAAGLDLLRRTGRPGAHGLTSPLILRSDGRKFGKSEEGTIWLDPERTSPFAFYQYFLGLPDADVTTLLRRLSLRPRAEIESLEAALADDPAGREAQRELARELTEMVHGEAGRAEAEEISRWLFGGEELLSLEPRELRRALRGGPVVEFAPADLESWDRIAVHAGLAASLSEARRTISGGGLYAADERITPELPVPSAADLAERGAMVLRKGKRRRVVAVLADGS